MIRPMNELELRHWLNRAFYADKKIKALDILIQRHRERAEGLSVCSEGNDKGKSDSTKNGTENALLKLAELEEKADRQRTEAVEELKRVQDAISLLQDDDLEAVLIHRYLLFESIEDTATAMHYAPRTVRDKQKKAIIKLCPLMPCFASFDVIS